MQCVSNINIFARQTHSKMKKAKIQNKETDEEDSQMFAFLGVFLTVIGFIIVLAVKKNSKYAMFYAKQGLIIFFVGMIISVVGWIPIFGQIISIISSIGLMILWILGMIYSLSGEMKEIPIIGKFAEKIRI